MFLLKTEFDNELFNLIEDEYEIVKKQLDKFILNTLLNHEFDKLNCLLEIHPGAGGTEACDWALMLYRMYSKYLNKKDITYEELEYQSGDETGIKSLSILVKGEYAYGYLKGETGIHRLVRISPFDSNSRRHTSFASVEVSPYFEDDINITINEKDLKIDVFRSSGCGGQGVNTTDSAVRITHMPTNTVVTCQNERSQIQNKNKALEVLKSKLYNLEIQAKTKEKEEKLKNQNKIDFGFQKRSYILHPYSLIKDHDTGYETSNTTKVLDGNIDEFIESYIKKEGKI